MNKQQAKERVKELREKRNIMQKNIMMMIIQRYQILNMICLW